MQSGWGKIRVGSLTAFTSTGPESCSNGTHFANCNCVCNLPYESVLLFCRFARHIWFVPYSTDSTETLSGVLKMGTLQKNVLHWIVFMFKPSIERQNWDNRPVCMHSETYMCGACCTLQSVAFRWPWASCVLIESIENSCLLVCPTVHVFLCKRQLIDQLC